MRTYCGGYRLKTSRTITTLDILQLCQDLRDTFNATYNSTEYEFEPEGISEGGIVFRSLPGNQYKTMRLGIYQCGKWPWVNIQKWKDDPITILQADVEVQTFLKAFDDAPLWTLQELKLFEQCFAKIGLQRVGAYPKKSSLAT